MMEHQWHYNCKIIRKDKSNGVVLCGNELIRVGARDDDIGANEMEMIDEFMYRVEWFNYSNRYKGVIQAKDFFYDDRYGGAGARIQYLLPDGIEQDISEQELSRLFEMEVDGIPLIVSEVEFGKI